MIRPWAWRCVVRGGCATRRVASAQCRTTSTTRASSTDYRPRSQNLSQSHTKLGVSKTNDVSDGPEWQEDDSPETEYDWSLDIAPLPVEEQEARFERKETGQFFSRIFTPCPACGMKHAVSFCPFVFEDNPRHFFKPPRAQGRFERRMENSQEFLDTVAFMRRTFVHRLPTHRHFPPPPSKLQDAPPLAKEWLHIFDERVHFNCSKAGQRRDGWDRIMPAYSFFSGHHATTDYDGKPFLIVFINSGHYDRRMPYEIEIIRGFVTEYNRGTKSKHNVSPEGDCRPIGVVMVSKRWHVSASAAASRQSCITVGIASEYSWFHGYARFGIHIGAKNNKLRDGFSWWSVGVSTEVPGHDQELKRFYMDKFADNSSLLTASTSAFNANFGYGLLRDVREPAELIFDREESRRDWHRIITWRRMLVHRAVDFYGTDTTQYKFLYAHAVQRDSVHASGRDLTGAEALPRWGQIQSLMAMADKPYEDQVIWRSIFEPPIGQESEGSIWRSVLESPIGQKSEDSAG